MRKPVPRSPPDTSTIRGLMEDAHKAAAPSMGTLSLLLTAGRGLTVDRLKDMSTALEIAAALLWHAAEKAQNQQTRGNHGR